MGELRCHKPQCTVQFSLSVCPTICDPMDCSMPDFPVHHQLLGKKITTVFTRGWGKGKIELLFCCLMGIEFQFCKMKKFWRSVMISSSVQSLSRVQLFATPWTAALQASLSITNSWSSTKPMSMELVMPSNHLILCHPLLLLPSVFPSIRVFSNESALRIRWTKYWNFSFNISPTNEHPGLISFRMDWLDLLAVQGTLKSLLQHHSSKASILWHSAFFIVQLSRPYMTTGKTIALTRQNFVDKIKSLLF